MIHRLRPVNWKVAGPFDVADEVVSGHLVRHVLAHRFQATRELFVTQADQFRHSELVAKVAPGQDFEPNHFRCHVEELGLHVSQSVGRWIFDDDLEVSPGANASA